MRPGSFIAGGWLCVADQAAISEVIARQAAAGCGFRNPMYRAALAGELRLAELLPGGRIPTALLAPGAGPTLINIGDDAAPVASSPGPPGFPPARRLAAWCGAALLHAAAGREEHYALAVEWARRSRRVLLVETNSANEAAWLELLNAEAARRTRARLPALLGLRISAQPGQSHPKAEGCA